jgi:hypothetical protein
MALVDGGRVDESDAFAGDECVVPKLFTLMLDSARCAHRPRHDTATLPVGIRSPPRRLDPARVSLTPVPSPRRPVPGDRRLYYFPKTPAGPRFSAVWVQGVVVHASGDGSRLVVDDGSGPPVVAVLSPDAATHSFRQSEFEAKRPGVGAYVAVVGTICGVDEVKAGAKTSAPKTKARYALRVSRLHDLSSERERESMWNVEVVEAFRVLELYHRRGDREGGAE